MLNAMPCDAMRCVCVLVCVAVGRENAIYGQARHGSTGFEAAAGSSAGLCLRAQSRGAKKRCSLPQQL